MPRRSMARLIEDGADGCVEIVKFHVRLLLHKHLFKAGFLEAFELIEFALLESDEGIEVGEIGGDFGLFTISWQANT